jgi:uncharacterized protein YndB with AHSA1/START domain
VSDLRENELLIEREFDAPLPLVFRLWESRDHMLRWWGPELFTAIELDWELTPGRAWRGAMTSKQYGLSRFGGVIREVQKNKRILFTFQWDENSGRDRDTLVTVTFAEKDGNTLQTFHQAPFSSVASRDSHVGGWNSLFNKQQIYVENIAVAEQHGFRA